MTIHFRFLKPTLFEVLMLLSAAYWFVMLLAMTRGFTPTRFTVVVAVFLAAFSFVKDFMESRLNRMRRAYDIEVDKILRELETELEKAIKAKR